MSSEVIVKLDAEHEWHMDIYRLPPMGHEEARRWLDAQFMDLDGEPLRPSGKVLLADKVLVVAREAGLRRLQDTQWREDYARAVHAALARPLIHVDVPAMSVSY